MIITLIPNEALGDVWEKASKFIDRGWDKAPGHFTSDDILMRIHANVECLWCVFDDNFDMIAAFTTMIEQYPLSRKLVISCLAGSRVKEWADDAMQIMQRFGKDQGCNAIIAHGRKGWERFGRDTEWTQVSSTYEFKLEN